jgi:flagellar motility protein MotE (MotC chaperone)
MSSPPVFVSRLVGLPLHAPDGSPVGKLSDVVLGHPAPGSPPPVVGFVAEAQRRQIFVGSNRVGELDVTGARLVVGTVDLRRFRLRTGEMLVRKDLFDKPVGREVINDIAIRLVAGEARSWEVAGVSLVSSGLIRRRRTGRLTGSDVLEALFPTTAMAQQISTLREMNAADAATAVVTMTDADRVAVAEAMGDEELAELLEELPDEEGVALLESLDVERAADVLEEMEADDAADLLGEMKFAEREEVLAAMDPTEADILRRLVEYSPESAGGLMNPYPIILGPTATVAEALAHIRDPDIPAAEASHVFVCEAPLETPTGRYLGPVGFQRLLREPPSTQLARCLDEGPAVVPPDLSMAELARRLAQYDVVAVPVADSHGRLLGTVSVDDVLDHLLPVGWRRRGATR